MGCFATKTAVWLVNLNDTLSLQSYFGGFSMTPLGNAN